MRDDRVVRLHAAKGHVVTVFVVYQSMYGNTHRIAEAIATGLADLGDVRLGSVSEIAPEAAAEADLLVVGGPTHVHGMSSATSRQAAADAAAEDDAIDLDATAGDPGLRDWLGELPVAPGASGAAFDTRIDKPALLTGSAAKGVAKQLRKHRYRSLGEPESFFVENTAGPLESGEAERAERWGRELARRFREMRVQAQP